MAFESLVVYDSWELNPIQIPSRSRLFQLKPVGIGTPMVESLKSYIIRLAEAHCVHPGILLTKEIAPLTNKKYVTSSSYKGLSGLFGRASALNGIGEMSRSMIMALSSLTLRQDLSALTLERYTDTLSVRNLFRTHKAWCPLCYQENSQLQEVVYEPLLWTFKIVDICPKHQCLLCSHCPHCNQTSSLLAWNSRPGYCNVCHQWLGVAESLPHNLKANFQDALWVAHRVGELLSQTALSSSQLAKENISRMFELVINEVTDGNMAAFARLLNIPKNSLWMWCVGRSLPQLDLLLKVSHLLQISVVDFLSCHEDVISSIQVNSQSHSVTKIARKSPKPFDKKGSIKALSRNLTVNANHLLRFQRWLIVLDIAGEQSQDIFPNYVIRLSSNIVVI